MKTGITLFIIGIGMLITLIVVSIKADWKIDQHFMSQATLTDRASTIESKSLHMTLLMEGIDKEKISGHNAYWLETSDNSYDSNYVILKEYQQRLIESLCMDVTSLEYQASIAQLSICKVYSSLSVIKSIWYKEHYPILWNWVGGLLWLLSIAILVTGIIYWIDSSISNGW